MQPSQQQYADSFRALHRSGLLILPNAADGGSARIIEAAGSAAIATSSAAVAWSLGYPDGEAVPFDRLLSVVRDIVRVIRVPLSVDVESGYAAEPHRVAASVVALIQAGAVGINVEDGAADPALLCAKISSIREAAERQGIALFINVRTDVYLRGLVSSDERVDETLARAERYLEAGADGLFVPALVDRKEISQVASECRMPLNVMWMPSLPDPQTLTALGVRRLSAGAAIGSRVLGMTAALAERFLSCGDLRVSEPQELHYARIDGLMDRT